MGKRFFDTFTSKCLMRNILIALLTFFLTYDYHASLVQNYRPFVGPNSFPFMLYYVITYGGIPLIALLLTLILGTMIAYEKEVGELYYMLTSQERKGTIYVKRSLNDLLMLLMISAFSSVIAFMISYPSIAFHRPISLLLALLYFVISFVGYAFSTYLIGFLIAIVTLSFPIALITSIAVFYLSYIEIMSLHKYLVLSLNVPRAVIVSIINYIYRGQALILSHELSFSHFLPLIFWILMVIIIFIAGERREIP